MKKNNLQEHHEKTFGKDESYDTFVKEIKSIAEGIMQLSLQAVQIYTPTVNRIISDTSATQHEVEYLMDYMLSHKKSTSKSTFYIYLISSSQSLFRKIHWFINTCHLC